MKILCYVSFKGPFGTPDAETFETSGIAEAAHFVAAGLNEHGLTHSAVSNRGDWAYSFIVRWRDVAIEVIVASTDEDRPIVVSIEGRVGVLGAGRPRTTWRCAS
jgi:hypothetical protein